jgi:uncharacterized membrane protein
LYYGLIFKDRLRQNIVVEDMSIAVNFKTYFLRGIAVLLPTILTIWIFIWGFGFIQKNISIHINRSIVFLVTFISRYHDEASKETLNKFWVEGAGSLAGFVLALIIVLAVGAMLASMFGRTLWRAVERLILRTPFFGQVYPYIKQLTDFMFSQQQQRKAAFSRVIAVEFPRSGVWVVGLVTGSGIKEMADNIQKEFLTIFIPSTPTPFTGYTLMVPKEQTVDLDMTIEEAFRFVVSGGVIIPPTSRSLNTADPSGSEVGPVKIDFAGT